MIKDFMCGKITNEINEYNGLSNTLMESIIISDYSIRLENINEEIMKYLMQKYYKDIPFEELDSTIREKYVEYFI